MNDGVTARFANHQICPLHNDNAAEEGRVTRVLQHLTLCVRLRVKKTHTHTHKNYKRATKKQADFAAIAAVIMTSRWHHELYLCSGRGAVWMGSLTTCPGE